MKVEEKKGSGRCRRAKSGGTTAVFVFDGFGLAAAGCAVCRVLCACEGKSPSQDERGSHLPPP